jgi:Secretion system C-terminal sorting domain
MLLRKNALLVFTVCTSNLLFAQANTVSSGGNATGAGGSVSYTIGQIDYTSATGTTGNVNQGVQQPYEFYAVNGVNEIGGSIALTIGPNPTTNEVILSVADYAKNDLAYTLTDMNGKIIIARTPFVSSAIINLENCTPGMYHLFISNKDNQTNSYKIIKH